MSNQNTLSGMTLRDLLKNPDLQHAPATVCGAPSLKGKKTNDEGADTDFMSAFLGPQLWDKNYNSSGFNLEYMDLDEFLCENLNEIPVVETVGWDDLMSRSPPGRSVVPQKTPSPHLSPSPHCSSDLYTVSSPCVSPGQHTSPPHSSHSASPASSITGPMGVSPVRMSSPSSTVIRAKAGAAKNAVLETASTRSMSPDVVTSSTTPPVSPHSVRVDFQLSEQDLVLSSIPGQSTFDPTSHCFTEDELKPQPMIKKSRKIFVPEDLKDERYWVRRNKNNAAAKRSRDARRVKENQIAMRVAYLEKENKIIQDEIEKMRRENAHLKHRLRKYDPSA